MRSNGYLVAHGVMASMANENMWNINNEKQQNIKLNRKLNGKTSNNEALNEYERQYGASINGNMKRK